MEGSSEEARKEKQKMSQLDHLRKLLNWSDDASQIVHSNSEKPHNLYRKGAFTIAVGRLFGAVRNKEITDPSTIQEIYKFVDTYTSETFVNQQLTKQEDVATLKKMLDLVLGSELQETRRAS